MDQLNGIILKGIGGFYYVEVSDSKIYECKARGLFRKNGLTPCAGDRVILSLQNDGYAAIDQIFPRRNCLIRPPVCNIDRLFIVVSTCRPSPNQLIIDKMIATAVYQGIEPILVFSKTDLRKAGELAEIYRQSAIQTIDFSAVTGQGSDEIKEMLMGKTSVFTGNSGVGKSSLLNCILPNLQLQTGRISQKLGRGKHTTRQVELFHIEKDTFVADTPGFSVMDLQCYDAIRKEELADCFYEFRPYLGTCKFTSCAHLCEKGCAVLDAVDKGSIHQARHQSYVLMYQELQEKNEWERK